jgi:hypothetical protein
MCTGGEHPWSLDFFLYPPETAALPKLFVGVRYGLHFAVYHMKVRIINLNLAQNYLETRFYNQSGITTIQTW